jgi:virulence-associated protein VapD
MPESSAWLTRLVIEQSSAKRSVAEKLLTYCASCAILKISKERDIFSNKRRCLSNMNLSSLQSSYAIVLNLDKTNLSLPYDEALSKICDVMDSFQFMPLTNNIYVCTSSKNQLALLYMLVQELSKNTWLRSSLVTLKAFKMDNISDFTDIIKGK